MGRIQHFDKKIIKESSEKSLAKTFGDISRGRKTSSPTIRENDIFLRINSCGYIRDNEHSSSAFQDAYSKLKAFIYLAILKDVFTYNKWSEKPDVELNSFYRIGKNDHIDLFFPEGVKRFLSGVEVSEKAFRQYAPSGKALGSLLDPYVKEGEEATKESKVKSFITSCREILEYLKKNKNEEGGRIRAAIEWGFESLINYNENFALIQACIGIEAIIGDKNPDKKYVISERIAYMFGKTEKQRKFYKDMVKEIFDARNDLIHSKKVSLDKSEKILLNNAQDLLKKIILRELHFFLNPSSY